MVEAVRDGAPAVVPALPLADTVKEVEPARRGRRSRCVGTPERARLRAVQTPQGFGRDTLVPTRTRTSPARATARPTTRAWSSSSACPVVVVPGHEEAFKVTRPLDLVLAEAVLARRRATDGF